MTSLLTTVTDEPTYGGLAGMRKHVLDVPTSRLNIAPPFRGKRNRPGDDVEAPRVRTSFNRQTRGSCEVITYARPVRRRAPRTHEELVRGLVTVGDVVFLDYRTVHTSEVVMYGLAEAVEALNKGDVKIEDLVLDGVLAGTDDVTNPASMGERPEVSMANVALEGQTLLRHSFERGEVHLMEGLYAFFVEESEKWHGDVYSYTEFQIRKNRTKGFKGPFRGRIWKLGVVVSIDKYARTYEQYDHRLVLKPSTISTYDYERRHEHGSLNLYVDISEISRWSDVLRDVLGFNELIPDTSQTHKWTVISAAGETGSTKSSKNIFVGRASNSTGSSSPFVGQSYEEDRQRAEEARQRAEEDARRKKAEEDRQHAEEARKRAEEEARLKKAEEDRQHAEEEARRKKAEEDRQHAEEEARKRAEEEARKRAEEEARRRAEEDARKRAEEEARKHAEEARKRAEEAARQRATPSVGAAAASSSFALPAAVPTQQPSQTSKRNKTPPPGVAFQKPVLKQASRKSRKDD